MADQTATPPAAAAAAEGGEGDPLDALDQALADDPAEGSGEPAEWKAPTQAEWEADQAAHKKALETEQGKLKRARDQAKRLREGKSADPADPAEEGAPAPAPDPKLAVWQRRAVRTAAEAALKDRGARPEFAKLALNELNAAEVEFDRNDEPELDEWLDEMEERYPALFVKEEAPAAAGRQAMGGVDQGRAAKGAGTAKKKSFGEQVLENSRRARAGR